MGLFRRTPSQGAGPPSFEDRLAQIGPGVPGHCPVCDGLGYIDNIDIGHRYQIQHCKECLHRWEYLFGPDGKVVGLTELDANGRPVTRSRVRTSRDVPVVPATPAPVAEPAASADAVVDLRDGVGKPAVLDLTGPTEAQPTDPSELSPAEWLRRSARR